MGIKVNNIADVTEVNGIANIAEINGITVPAGGIAFVQSASGTTADGSAGLTVNFGVPVTAGNSVIALISCVNANEPTDLTGPTCVGGGAAGLSNAVGVAPSPNFQAIIFYLHNVAGGETGVTYSLQGDAGRASMQILEVSGLADAAAEATGTGSGNSTDVLIDGFSNTTPIALAVAIGAWNANNYNNGPADGWTRVGTGTGGANVWQESAYKILSVAEAQGTQWTLDPSADFAIAAAVFGAA